VNRTSRQLQIRQILERQEFVDVESLCRQLEASESTIRRDLVELERQRLVKRVHGGALAAPPRDHILDHDWQARRQAEEKRRIGRLAATLIEDGETVILDGGSTVACVADELANRPVHVITNSLAIAHLLRAPCSVEVTLTGGYLFPRLQVMLGPLCERMLESVAADAVVMGIGGITEAGFSNNNTLVVGSELRMIEVSRRVIIVADASKFGRSAMVPVAPLDIADVVVSDASLAPEHRRMLEDKGVRVLLT
jgi:DeoR family fructose operon transcriptional repressor